jgi:predicted DNA-binding protein YlxM (UPF0122 family)/Pyruvate/2-oxoacid:ferredoxin oxidoreductase delta subunit
MCKVSLKGVKMDNKSFVDKQVALCTKSPTYKYLADNYKLYTLLKDRSIKDFGENLFVKYCANREVCGDVCIGRPIPMYPEVMPMVQELNNVTVGTYKGQSVWLVKVSLCDGCPIKNFCTAMCPTVDDYFNRHESEYEVNEVNMVDIHSLREGELEEEIYRIDSIGKLKDPVERMKVLGCLAWDVLSERQKYVVTQRLYTDTDFEHIAITLGVSRQAACKLFGTGYQKLIEYSKARVDLTKNYDEVRYKYYVENKNIKNIAKELNISKNNVASKLLK